MIHYNYKGSYTAGVPFSLTSVLISSEFAVASFIRIVVALSSPPK